MKLENEFVVPVPRDQAWDVLMDVERIAPCMPGATFDGYDGDASGAFKGRVKVKLGPITVTYAGVAKFVEKDKDAGRAVIDAAGKESRGSGTANATIETVLVDDGDSTLVKVTTDLNITGKPAQFGRGVMVEVGTKILGQFATCLADKLAAGEPAESPLCPQPRLPLWPHLRPPQLRETRARPQRRRPTTSYRSRRRRGPGLLPSRDQRLTRSTCSTTPGRPSSSGCSRRWAGSSPCSSRGASSVRPAATPDPVHPHRCIRIGRIHDQCVCSDRARGLGCAAR